MDLTVPNAASAEFAAAFLQAVVTLGLAALFAFLYRRYRKPYYGYWSLAWLIFALRIGAIISFLATGDAIWLYWHQVTTGLAALALLWAALVFAQQLRWRNAYATLVVFPAVWSYVAIYQMENFFLAAGPAVLFLSAATLGTAWAFYRHHRRVRSAAALFLAVALLLWGLHHLDYPFLRARGVWNPWGYYLDLVFELAMGAGVLLLVLEDLGQGLSTLSALSADLQRSAEGGDPVAPLLGRPLTLPGVNGSAIYLGGSGGGQIVGARGACEHWMGADPPEAVMDGVSKILAHGRPEVVRSPGGLGAEGFTYVAVLPILRESAVVGALLVTGKARDPFAALDSEFLVAIGQQVGAALENADLYRRLEARKDELERLASRMVQQHEEERRRLSRELHDETAQLFAAVKLELGMLREAAPEALGDRFDRALGMVDAGIGSIRSVTRDLRPSLLDDLGLLPALRALGEEFRRHSGMELHMRLPKDVPPLSEDGELALFRAFQEGLSNVGRHAGAARVEAGLVLSRGQVVLTVQDDGRGLPWDDESEGAGGERMGLTGMRERIAGLGGSVRLANGTDAGTLLTVSLPGSEAAPPARSGEAE